MTIFSRLKILQTTQREAFRLLVTSSNQFVVSGSGDGTVRVWDLLTHSLIHTFTGHEDRVTSGAISGDGQFVVSGSWDNTVRVWRVRWQDYLKICCDRLRYHPVFQNRQYGTPEAAFLTCQKYVWSSDLPNPWERG